VRKVMFINTKRCTIIRVMKDAMIATPVAMNLATTFHAARKEKQIK
jgi:hypothetical protein